MSIESKEVATKLGISIGTRYIGIAVLRKGELIDWRIRNFSEEWSLRKRDRILRMIQHTIIKHAVSVVVIKTPAYGHWSYRLKDLIQSVYALSDANGIYVEACTIKTLEKRRIQNGRANKGILIDALIKKYPELKSEYIRYKRKRDRYYEKVFEAVACAEIGLETGH